MVQIHKEICFKWRKSTPTCHVSAKLSTNTPRKVIYSFLRRKTTIKGDRSGSIMFKVGDRQTSINYSIYAKWSLLINSYSWFIIHSIHYFHFLWLFSIQKDDGDDIEAAFDFDPTKISLFVSLQGMSFIHRQWNKDWNLDSLGISK